MGLHEDLLKCRASLCFGCLNDVECTSTILFANLTQKQQIQVIFNYLSTNILFPFSSILLSQTFEQHFLSSRITQDLSSQSLYIHTLLDTNKNQSSQRLFFDLELVSKSSIPSLALPFQPQRAQSFLLEL